jgi:hypothetical protein
MSFFMVSKTDNSLVYVASSPIHGEGLFAACALKAGQLIGFYKGDIVDAHDHKSDGMHVLWIEEEDDHWVGYDGKNSMRFMNHSDQPNAEMNELECYALVDIPARQEITIDYGWGET